MLRYSLYNEDQIREPDVFESYSSDNSSAAENQQERLVKIGWITGFVDGGDVSQSTSCDNLIDQIDEATEPDSKWLISLMNHCKPRPGNDQNPQRLHARHRIQSGEDIVRSAWRHAGQVKLP